MLDPRASSVVTDAMVEAKRGVADNILTADVFGDPALIVHMGGGQCESRMHRLIRVGVRVDDGVGHVLSLHDDVSGRAGGAAVAVGDVAAEQCLGDGVRGFGAAAITQSKVQFAGIGREHLVSGARHVEVVANLAVALPLAGLNASDGFDLREGDGVGHLKLLGVTSHCREVPVGRSSTVETSYRIGVKNTPPFVGSMPAASAALTNSTSVPARTNNSESWGSVF
eukprot:TRINITY_DN48995_c0_g1_i1.p1 TRINITY_DN48995_c0_g1~~TRINITY_DN48995_c0_g1_i1.p1  ORF type:complete len:247 (-),score=30.57 TRINITY_DN48995_c0_g1_i1:93-767(-)